MWKDLMHNPAWVFHRAFLRSYAMQLAVLCPYKADKSLQESLFNYGFLLEMTGEVYNLHIDMVMRRAPSRQQSNP
jgi:hypothetical protein